MRESGLWHTVHENLQHFGRMVRIEDRVGLGTPDVAYTLRRKPVLPAASGWVELKRLDTAPVRPTTPVRVPHLTQEQVTWLQDEEQAGGRAWLLLRVARWYCLLLPKQAVRLHAGGYKLEDLLVDGCVPGELGFPTKRILTCLTQ